METLGTNGMSSLATLGTVGTMEDISYFVEQTPEAASSFPALMREAAQAGNVDVLNYLTSVGADPDLGIEIAAQNGHSEAVRILLQKNGTPQKALNGAVVGGQRDTIILILSYFPSSLNIAVALGLAIASGTDREVGDLLRPRY